MTLAPQPHSSDSALSKSVESLLARDAAALEAIFRTDDLLLSNGMWSPFLPFLSWLVSSLSPELTVDLGFEVDPTLQGVWRAAQRPESTSRYTAVLLYPAGQSDQEFQTRAQQLNDLIVESATRFGGVVEGAVETAEGVVEEDGDAVAAGFPPVHLLLLRLSDDRVPSTEYLQKWIARMTPGAVLVVPNVRGTESPEFSTTRRFVTDLLPATVVSLGAAAEALVAQVPDNGAAPLVDLLRDGPSAFRGLFLLFAERRRIPAPDRA